MKDIYIEIEIKTPSEISLYRGPDESDSKRYDERERQLEGMRF